MAKSTKKTKSLKLARKARITRPDVVSFRITSTQCKNLKTEHEENAAMGVKTPNQLARKVVCDFLAGRLKYSNPADRLQDFEPAS